MQRHHPPCELPGRHQTVWLAARLAVSPLTCIHTYRHTCMHACMRTYPTHDAFALLATNELFTQDVEAPSEAVRGPPLDTEANGALWDAVLLRDPEAVIHGLLRVADVTIERAVRNGGTSSLRTMVLAYSYDAHRDFGWKYSVLNQDADAVCSICPRVVRLFGRVSSC